MLLTKKQVTCEHCGATFSSPKWINISVKEASLSFPDNIELISEDPQIATIQADGVSYLKGMTFTVTGISPGSTSIYVSTTDGSVKSPEVKVTVLNEHYAMSSSDETLTDSSESMVEESQTDAQKVISRITQNAADAQSKNTTEKSESNSSSGSASGTDSSVEGYRNESLNGRGMADSGREEPHYVGVIGYAAIAYSQEYELKNTDDFANEDLWAVPTYIKDKQFWEENGTLPHKTEIVVLKQVLEHEGYGNYSGYLLVERTDDHSQYYIDVDNFITKPYWTYPDLYEAIKVGAFVAEYNQTSDYWPVDSGGDKLEIPDGTRVLVTGITGSSRNIDRSETDLTATVWKEWKYGYGGVECHFNHKDLTLVY